MQGFFRRKRARAERKEIQHKEDAAATSLQSAVRGRAARRGEQLKEGTINLSSALANNAFTATQQLVGSAEAAAKHASDLARQTAWGVEHAVEHATMSVVDGAQQASSRALVSAGLKRGASGDEGGRVDEPTPAENWFTPAGGWPAHLRGRRPEWKEPPEALMPTAAEAPVIFEDASRDAIGELKVEVLAARGLPGLDVTGSSDPYAVIIFESNAARTNAWRQTRKPLWGPESARAFRLPVRCPYSCLYVGLKDADDVPSFGGDDDIGRVVLELGSLYARTEYDGWLPLQRRNILPPGRRGALRLRFSVHFYSDRERLMRYVLPQRPPVFHIPFVSKVAKSQARFVLHGKLPDATYDRETLRLHVQELTEFRDFATSKLTEFCKQLLYWNDLRSAFLSIVSGVWWQLLVSYPQYVPASCPLAILLLLLDSHIRHIAKYPIQTKPSFVRLCMLIFLPVAARPAPLTADPVPHDPSEVKVSELQWWLDGRVAKSVKRTSPVGNKRACPLTLGASSDATFQSAAANWTVTEGSQLSPQPNSKNNRKSVNVGPSNFKIALPANASEEFDDSDDEGEADLLATQLQRITREVRGHYEAITDVPARAAEEQDRKGRQINPLALILAPVQRRLGKSVQPLRVVQRVLTWSDRIVTTWVALALIAATLVFAIVPWGGVLHIGLRVVGLALFGPHMYWVGRYIARTTDNAVRQEREYRRADEAGKKAILDEHRARLMALQEKKSLAVLEKQQRGRREVVEYLKQAKHLMAVEPRRLSSRLKYRALLDPHSSRAYPEIAEGVDAMAREGSKGSSRGRGRRGSSLTALEE